MAMAVMQGFFSVEFDSAAVPIDGQQINLLCFQLKPVL